MRNRMLAALCGTALAATGLVATATDASAASCTSPKVVYHTLIKYRSSSVGYIDLEYSVACHSARAHVHSVYVAHPGDTHGAWADIHRNSDGASHSCSVHDGKQDCTTAWIYDRGVTSYAHGEIDMYPVDLNYVAKASTPSY